MPAVEQQEEKHHWIVIFNQHGKVYTYMYRTVPYMTEVIKKFHDQHNRWPYRMWAIVDGEMERVIVE